MKKSSSKTPRQAIVAGGALLGACAVCCAPLIIPPLVAVFAAGGVSLAVAGQTGLGIAALIALGGYLFWRRRRTAKNASSCGCSPASACGTSSQPQHDAGA